MSVVRVHPAHARDLINEYDAAARTIEDVVSELSPLLTHAFTLLDQPGQHPLYGPLPTLIDVATELAVDGRDLGWRLDHILASDATPIGTSALLRLDSAGSGFDDPDMSLVDALIAAGLTKTQARRARQAILSGERFATAVEAERTIERSENMAAFRRVEADSWLERTPVEQAEYSLDQIRTILDTARQDKDHAEGIGAGGISDGVWSTNDLKAVIENRHGYYTSTQVDHARAVLAMAESSSDARELLGITESGGGWTFTDIGHLTFDILGMMPVVGNAADAANAAWYAAEGDYLNAALSSLGMIPVLGQAVIAAKPMVVAASAGVVFKSLDEALTWAKRWLESRGILKQADEFGAVAPSRTGARGVDYDEFGTPTAVDHRVLFAPTNMANDPLLADVAVQREIAEAWKDSVDVFTYRENGGWIVQSADGTHSVTRWPQGGPANIAAPRDVPDGVVGAFHTHPNVAGYATPSKADISAVQRRNELAPHYVVSHEGMFRIERSGRVEELG